MPRNKLSQFERQIRDEISNNLKRLIKERGITQRQLSDKAGITYSTLSGYFTENSTPNAGMVQKMADALNVMKSDIDPRFNESIPDGAEKINVSDFVQVPLLGEIACGDPITADENIESYIPTNKSELPSGVNFWLTSKGDSMKPTIPDGSKVLIHQQPEVMEGDIAAVLIDDEATLKRVKRSADGHVLLLPDNSDYDAIVLDGSKEVKIVGKAIEIKILL